MKSNQGDATKSVHEIFYQRASSLKKWAAAFLAFIFVLLGLGAVIFVTAASFTASDLQANVDDLLSQNQEQHNRLMERINTNNSQTAAVVNSTDQEFVTLITEYTKSQNNGACGNLSNVIQLWDGSKDPAIEGIKKSGLAKIASLAIKDALVHGFYVYIFGGTAGAYCLTINELNHFVGSLQAQDFPKLKDYNKLQNESAALGEQLNFLNRVHDGLYNRKVEGKVYGSKQPQSEDVLPQTNAIVSLAQTSITRFGTLAIISFLVAILVPLYRYNMRLAAFYMARGDAFLLKQNGLYDFDLSKTVDILTPPYDFGKVPPTPSQQIIDLVQALRRAKE